MDGVRIVRALRNCKGWGERAGDWHQWASQSAPGSALGAKISSQCRAVEAGLITQSRPNQA